MDTVTTMANDECCMDGIAGCVGTLIDDLPLLTTAHVRPYIIAILLHRGAVRPHEALSSISPHCRVSDLRVGEWDPLEQDWSEETRAERLIDEVLGELISEGIVRYNEEMDLWVLASNQISTIISWVAAMGARMPQHVLLEMSRDQIKRIPQYIELS
jgi:hypothetical protein